MSSELLKRILSSIVLIPISFLIIIKGSTIFNLLILILLLISVFEWIRISISKLQTIFGMIFLIFSFYSVYKIRNDFVGEYFYIFFVLIICISTDIGGFVFGKILKGPKLTKISPNKTYSGVFGSYIFSLIFSYIYINQIIFNFENSLDYKVFFYILLISSISQIGDIFISYFKRLSNFKNTGNIIPGHGGILDRIDGMIFAFPFSYFLFSLNFLKLL